MLEPISRLDESLAGGPSAENKHSVPRAPRHQTQNLRCYYVTILSQCQRWGSVPKCRVCNFCLLLRKLVVQL